MCDFLLTPYLGICSTSRGSAVWLQIRQMCRIPTRLYGEDPFVQIWVHIRVLWETTAREYVEQNVRPFTSPHLTSPFLRPNTSPHPICATNYLLFGATNHRAEESTPGPPAFSMVIRLSCLLFFWWESCDLMCIYDHYWKSMVPYPIACYNLGVRITTYFPSFRNSRK